MKYLQYPNDRVPGFTQLSCNGVVYVPKERDSYGWKGYVRYWRAWRELMKRSGGKGFEPSALSNDFKITL
jgi:hypothetical protein